MGNDKIKDNKDNSTVKKVSKLKQNGLVTPEKGITQKRMNTLGSVAKRGQSSVRK